MYNQFTTTGRYSFYCTPVYTSFPKYCISLEKNENLKAFFNQYKRRFFERRSLKRPVYTLKLNQEGKIVRDKNGILVVLVNSYVQGELKTTKQLLHREAVDGVLSSLDYIKGVLGEDTCLIFHKTTTLCMQGSNFSELYCLFLWVVPVFSCAKSSGWM